MWSSSSTGVVRALSEDLLLVILQYEGIARLSFKLVSMLTPLVLNLRLDE